MMRTRFLISLLLASLGLSFEVHATNTQWNSADTSGSVTLTSSDTIATSSASGSRLVRAVDPQTSGKYYFECKLTVQASGSTGCGVASDYAWAQTMATSAGYSALAYKGGSVWRGLGQRATLGALGTSDVICWAVDLDNGNFWVRKNAGNWNNDAAADPATNTNGLTLSLASVSSLGVGSSSIALPVYPAAVLAASGDQVTMNFGDTTFAQAVPSGFTSGWPTNPITSPSGWYRNASYNVASFSGNQSLTLGGTSSSYGAQTNYNRSTGKYYVEFMAVRQTGATYGVGIVNASIFPYNAGADNNGIYYIASSGIVKRNNATQATYSTWTTNDVISEAIDLDNNRIWFRKNGGDWNGNAANDPATNTGGIDISALAKPLRPVFAESGGPTSGTDSLTGSFGYYQFAYGVPSGFTAGWPINGPQINLNPQGFVVHAPMTHH